MSSTSEPDWKTEAPNNESDVNKEEPIRGVIGKAFTQTSLNKEEPIRGVIGKASFTPTSLNKEVTATASHVTINASLTDKNLKRRGTSTENAGTMKNFSTQKHKKGLDGVFTEKEVKMNQLFTGNDINAHDHRSKIALKTDDISDDTKAQHHSSPSLKSKRELSGHLETASDSSDLKGSEVSKQGECGGWSVSDASLALQGEYALMFTDMRPTFVTISGTKWQEGALLQFLNKLSQVECPVYLTPRDTLWKPSEVGKKTSRARMETLLAEEHKCELIFVWGALDLPTVRSMPKSVKNVGIALSVKEDMQLVHELDRWSNQLEFIHFSFFKSFKMRHWGNRTFKPHSVSSVRTCLHFPDLHTGDLQWMKSIISVVVPRVDQKSCVWGLYFPGSSLSANALLSEVMLIGLQCKVFLSANRTPNDEERKTVMKKFKRHKCSVQWILEII